MMYQFYPSARASIGALLILQIAACSSESGLFGGKEREEEGPEIREVSITPRVPYVDGEVECDADVKGDARLSYRWRNESRGSNIGSGRSLTLDPRDISPGDVLRCEVTATDNDGNKSEAHDNVKPGCGSANPHVLRNIDVDVSIVFRPIISDDLNPGYEGEPWDWDGDVPDWIIDMVDTLDVVLELVEVVYPTPQVVTAGEVVDIVDEILAGIEEYGPELLEGTVPPDPNLFPYLMDTGESLTSFSDVPDGWTWDDSYDVSFQLYGQDFERYPVLLVDMEDYDAAFDDNMGDLLDHDSIPLAIAGQVFADAAYCTATYYNPTHRSQETDTAIVPSSILWMAIEVQPR